jgi:hypothetical protein
MVTKEALPMADETTRVNRPFFGREMTGDSMEESPCPGNKRAKLVRVERKINNKRYGR